MVSAVRMSKRSFNYIPAFICSKRRHANHRHIGFIFMVSVYDPSFNNAHLFMLPPTPAPLPLVSLFSNSSSSAAALYPNCLKSLTSSSHPFTTPHPPHPAPSSQAFSSHVSLGCEISILLFPSLWRVPHHVLPWPLVAGGRKRSRL